MAPATHPSRTYSRKSLSKRKRVTGQAVDAEEIDSTDSGSRKKFKSTRYVEDRVADDAEELDKPKFLRTHGSASKRRQKSPTPPIKPAALARSLSEVFESVTPLESPVGTPRKLARHMLARSKTESSLEASPSDSSFLQRLPLLDAPTTPTRDKGKQKAAEGDSSVVPLPLPPSNITRTYAGKSRSFLITIPASSLGSDLTVLPPGMNVAIGDEEDDYLNRESYSSLRARWGVDNSEDDPYPADHAASPSKRRSGSNAGTPNGSPSRAGKGSKKGNVPIVPLPPGMMNPLKSITELRSKGESRRFLDEIGYLFEGMEKKGAISLRRTGALDIVTKLCDAEFARKAKAADFLGRIWDVFINAGAGQDEDKILDLLLAFLAALISRDGASLADLAQRPSGSRAGSPQHYTSFVDTLFCILTSCTKSSASDLLRLVDSDSKQTGVTKKDRAQLIAVYDVVASKSRLFPRKTPITMPLLITYTLQRLPTSLIHSRYLSILLTSLRISLSPLTLPPPQLNASAKPLSGSSLKTTSKSHFPPVTSHLEWRNAMPRISFESASAHLHLLDTFLLGQWRIPDNDDDGNDDEDGKSGRNDDTEDILNRAKEEWLPEALVALAVCAEMRLRSQDADVEKAEECLDLILRILVSQTHSDKGWSQAVLRFPCSFTFMVRLVAWAGDTYYSLSKEEESNPESRNHVTKNDRDRKQDHKEAEGIMYHEEEVGRDNLTEIKRAEGHEGEIQWQDRLCLALGLLANLVQGVSEAKDVLRETRVDPNCPIRKVACIHGCCCSKSIGGLDILTRLYSRQDDSIPSRSDIQETQGHATYFENDKQSRRVLDTISLLGHLAVLFGLLMHECTANEDLIVASLPAKTKGEGRRVKLSRLVEQARALVSFDAALNSASEGPSIDQDDGVAREVVVYLQGLRDAGSA